VLGRVQGYKKRADPARLCEDCAMDRVRDGLAALCMSIAAASAIAAEPQQGIVLQGIDCRGDDPAWRLDAARTTASFTATVPRKREVVFRGSLQAIASPTAPILVWRGDTTHLPRETVVLTAREAACKTPGPDAAAGTHRAVLSVRVGEAVMGCCVLRVGYDARVAPVANLGGKEATDWSRQLVELLPAINACVSKEGAKLKAVAAASPQGSGTVKVRLVETGGNAVDCTAEASGRGTPAFAPVSAADAAVPGGPLFYPPREPPPLVSCGRLERVQTPRGALAGYLHYEPC